MSEATFPQNFAYRSPDIAVKYAIPYRWGALHVSEEAHQAYELIPFRPTEAGGLSEGAAKAYTKKASPLHISLLAPGEIGLSPRSDFETLEAHAKCDARSLEGVSVNIGFSATTAIINRSDEVHKLFATSDLACDGAVENRGAQHIAHALTHTLSNVGPMLATNRDLREATLIQGDLRVARNVASGAAIGAAALGGIEAVVGTDHFHASPLVLLPALLLLAHAAWRTKKNGEKYLNNKTKNVHNLQAAADTVQVERDIHATYCSAHFNTQAAQSYDL